MKSTTLMVAVAVVGGPGICPGSPADDADRAVLRAVDFGVMADGMTDDGPAILRLMDAALAEPGKVTVAFPGNKVIAVRTGRERYLFAPRHKTGLVIDGGGSEFRLDKELRLMDAFACEGFELRNLKVDYLEPVTTAGTIVGFDEVTKSIDVQLDHPGHALRLGGPTREDGEQAFFGMIHMDAVHGMKRVTHYYVGSVQEISPGVVRVFNPEDQFRWKNHRDRIHLGETKIGIPVPGVAHRFGPGALVEVFNCREVLFENVEVWAAPWFSFRIFRNDGLVTMRNVNVRPKPGSGKVLSSCRDAFHAKGNRAELVFENCILDGLGDDAFNLSTHCSRITKVHSGSRIEIRQAFPLQYIPPRAGDEVVVMSPETNQLIGSAVIKQVKWTDGEGIAKYDNRFRGRAPLVMLVLEKAIPDLQRGLVIWDRQTANPRSLVKGCRIRRSCRFQTPVRLENCDVEAYMTFYGDKSEGPGPEWFEIVGSTIKSASVGDVLGTSVGAGGFEGSSGKPEWEITPEKAQLKRVTITGNEIWGGLRIRKALDVVIRNNRIVFEGDEPVSAEFCGKVDVSSNRHSRTPAGGDR